MRNYFRLILNLTIRFFEPGFKLGFEFFNFWLGYIYNVWIVGIALVIILMFFFGFVELRIRHYLRNNFTFEFAALGQRSNILFGLGFLAGIMVKNNGTVLLAN